MRIMDVERFADTHVGTLSSGEQTRVAIAKAMLNRPALLLLDEPTVSLDPSSAQLVREKIRAFAANGSGILWTSHNMQEVTEVCDRVFFPRMEKSFLKVTKTLPREHGKKTWKNSLSRSRANRSHSTYEFQPYLRYRLALLLPPSRTPATHVPDLHLEYGRHRAVGIHHEIFGIAWASANSILRQCYSALLSSGSSSRACSKVLSRSTSRTSGAVMC